MAVKFQKGQKKHNNTSTYYLCVIFQVLWYHTLALCEEQTKIKVIFHWKSSSLELENSTICFYSIVWKKKQREHSVKRLLFVPQKKDNHTGFQWHVNDVRIFIFRWNFSSSSTWRAGFWSCTAKRAVVPCRTDIPNEMNLRIDILHCKSPRFTIWNKLN